MAAINPNFEISKVVGQETSVALTLAGPWAANQTVTVTLTKLGSVVFMHIPETAAVATATTVITTASGSLPVGYRPSAAYYSFAKIQDNSASVDGALQISTAGAVSAGVGATIAGTFTAANNAGFRKQVITYTVE